MATHSSVLAWRIPGTGEPGGLPSLGSHRVGHDWSDLAAAVYGMCHILNGCKKWKWKFVTQSCLILCNPIDCSLPGSSVHGILQATVLEWVVISLMILDVYSCERCFYWKIACYMALPWWLSGKESICQYRRHVSDLWVGKIPWRRKWQPALVLLLGKSHGQRSLVGQSMRSQSWTRLRDWACMYLSGIYKVSNVGLFHSIYARITFDWNNS